MTVAKLDRVQLTGQSPFLFTLYLQAHFLEDFEGSRGVKGGFLFSTAASATTIASLLHENVKLSRFRPGAKSELTEAPVALAEPLAMIE